MEFFVILGGFDKGFYGSYISNSLQGIIPYSAKVLHMASKGDNSFMKEILEGLGLSNQKDIIIEFLSIISNENLVLKEIGFKLGLFEEEIDVLETLVDFIMTLTEYRSKVKAQEKVVNKEETKTSSNTKNSIDREFVDPIKTKIYHLLMTLVKNGAVDARAKTLRNKNHIHSIVNRYAHKFRMKYSRVQDTLDNINSKLSIEEIQDFCRSQADKLIEENDIKEKEIISSVVEYLGLTKKNYNYLKSFCIVALSFKQGKSLEELNAVNEIYDAFRETCTMLEISESHLELLLDIISGSPLRIFKLKESESERDFKKFNFATDNEARLNTLCDTHCFKTLNKF